jgi:hypothetical protein
MDFSLHLTSQASLSMRHCSEKSIPTKQINNLYIYTVDSRYLEFDGTMEKIRVNRSSTQEEL